MTQQTTETVSTALDKLKMGLALLLFVGGVAAFYGLSGRGVYVQWLALIASLVLGLVVFLISESGRGLVGFSRASVNEVKKVVWPTRKESITMTLYVFGFVAIMAVFLLITDKTIEWVLYDLLLGWRK